MDLVREIHLALEQHPHGFAPDELRIDGFTEEQVGYHAYIMGQAGLIRGCGGNNRSKLWSGGAYSKLDVGWTRIP
jgi:hypothetical protein